MREGTGYRRGGDRESGLTGVYYRGADYQDVLPEDSGPREALIPVQFISRRVRTGAAGQGFKATVGFGRE